MNQDELKQQVALAALQRIRPYLGVATVLGIGTGSTADLFIDALATERHAFAAAVASSERSAQRLARHGIRVVDLNDVASIPVYVDGADEIEPGMAMIKGGGGALTREKIVAAVAERFVCIADVSKLVAQLGRFPLPVEVIPMARAQVERQLVKVCGPAASVRLRVASTGEPYLTDNGNLILDVHGLSIADPVALEAAIDRIVGVVSSGLFAARGADLLLLATEAGIQATTRPGVPV